MRKNYIKHLFTALLLLCATMATAQRFVVDGIYYELIYDENGKATAAEVSYSDSEEYTGNIVIPSTVTYEWNTYSVTRIGDGAFEECNGVASVEIPNSITEIGEWAFDDSGIESIMIPGSVKVIGVGAFQDCESLVSMTIGNGVTDIKEEAICFCPLLSSIVIPASVTNIEAYNFTDCPALESIIVEAGNEVYDSRNNCNAIIEKSTKTLLVGCKNTVIPNDVKIIGEDAFTGCTGLTSIVIPEGVTTIGNSAFYECSSLVDIRIPSSVTYIDDYTFEGCTSLSDVTIPDGVTYIGKYAFSECPIESFDIPNSVNEIGYGAFYNCSALTEINIPNSVKSIGEGAFAGCTNLVNAKLPDGLTAVENYLFVECTSLTSIVIPNGVTRIGDLAFSECPFTEVVIPDGVTTLGYGVFGGCNNLETITIPESLVSIDEDAFAATPWYDAIPDGVVYIGNVLYAYKGTMDDKDTVINVKPGTVSIAEYAFYDCTGLVSITLPNSVTTIGRGAFWGCHGLEELDIPNSVTSIGRDAFNATSWYEMQPDGLIYVNNVLYQWKGDMPEKTDIVVRDGTVSISDCAFESCNSSQNLMSVTIPGSVKVIGESAFCYVYSVSDVTLGEGIEVIGDYAFEGCDIKDIVIPNSVKHIGDYAFRMCGLLESVTLGTGVEYLGDWAFRDCGDLTDVYCLATAVPSTGIMPFDEYTYYDGANYLATMTLHVPASSLDAYKTTEPWSGFGTIRAIGETGINEIAGNMVVACCNGVIAFTGCEDGSVVSVYTIDGAFVGSAVASDGEAQISTGLEKGDVAVVNIAGKGIKIVMQ